MATWKPLVIMAILAGSAAAAGTHPKGKISGYAPTDAERARWTMSDMRSLATAIEAYAVDNRSYPSAETIEGVIAAVQPSYIRKAPATDAWGHSFVYVPAADGQSYRLVSAGADGRTDKDTWNTVGPLKTFEDDAVLEAGAVVRPWPFL